MKKTDDLQAWRIFCAVVESSSVNAACERLGIEPSTASRTLKALEEDVGSAFFSRETRPSRLTDFGRSAYEQAKRLVEHHRLMLEGLQGEKEALSGVIRIAAHAGVGPGEITPALMAYQSRFPEVHMELQELRVPAERAFEVPAASGAFSPDVSVGYGTDKPLPGVVRRYCGEMPFVACASEAYLARAGRPEHPNELAKHTGILLQTPTRTTTECLACGSVVAALRWGRTNTFTSLASALSAVRLGGGIMPDLALHHFAEAVDAPDNASRLQRILPGWQRPSASCYVFCSEQAWTKRRVRDFVEWLAEHERTHLSSLRERFPDAYQHPLGGEANVR